MKKYGIILLLFTAVSIYARSSTERNSQTFMNTRPINQNVAAAQSGWHNILYNKPGDNQTSFQLYGIYQTSIGSKRNARYFLPFECKNELLVAGDSSTDLKNRDIRAEWLGINNAQFSGKFTLDPHQKQIAIFLEANKNLGGIIDSRFFENTWLSINVPIVAVENDLRLRQSDIFNLSQAAPQDIAEALGRKELCFSRIARDGRTDFGMAEINIKLGRAYLSENDFEVVYYSGLRIPGARAQNADFLFDSYLGNNKHLGFQTGVNFQINLSQDTSYLTGCFFANLESTFFIRNKQLRTFDLKGKPWSRYMLLNRMGGPPDQNIPATKILTLRTRVKPYNMVELSAGWRIKTDCVEAEVGYDLWAHGDEDLECFCKFEEVYGIAGDGANGQGLATSASQSTITTRAANDMVQQTICEECTLIDNFVVICKSDLDRKSAAARAAINHKFHAAFSYVTHGKSAEGFITIGALYEYPQKNTALELWAFWIKCGASF